MSKKYHSQEVHKASTHLTSSRWRWATIFSWKSRWRGCSCL